ncbi:MAG: ABC transporter ATP-binding protein [Pseudomonadota bacterium]
MSDVSSPITPATDKIAPTSNTEVRPTSGTRPSSDVGQKHDEKPSKKVSDEEAGQINSSFALASRLWRSYLRPYRAKLIVSLAAMAAYSSSMSAIPVGVELINSTFTDEVRAVGLPRIPILESISVAIWGPLLIVLLGAVNALSQYAHSRFSASAALSGLYDIQKDFYRNLVHIDDAQLRALGTGQTVARLTNDTTVLRETLSRAANAVRDLLTLIFLLGLMFYYDWALFLVVFVVFPVLGWPVGLIGKRLRRLSKQAQDQAGDIASLGVEAVSGGRVIRAYALERPASENAAKVFAKRRNVLMRMAHLKALNEPFIFFVASIAIAIVTAVVSVRINAGALGIPQLVSFIVTLLLMSQPARGLSTMNAVAQEGFGAFERLLAVIDAEPTIRDAENAGALELDQSRGAAGAITFKGVSFGYNEEAAAVTDLNLTIDPGNVVALVGASGAGKSTLFNLVQRFYEVDQGQIEIDGQPISEVTLKSLREAIAVVSQETILFNDTIKENIRYGRLDASDTEIETAARDAAAHDFIMALPKGYNTIVGEGGLNLSGGQRQRLAIARAFLKDAPILLLDEATSALDAETERQVQDALTKLSRGRTTLVIAHRLATVKDADRIIVMDQGQIVQMGNHDSLTREEGAYRQLAALQFGAMS